MAAFAPGPRGPAARAPAGEASGITATARAIAEIQGRPGRRPRARQQGRGTRRHYNLRWEMHRNFVKFTFLKIDPAWRRLDAAERERHKREFEAACDNFAADRFLRAFSLVGTRGDADLLLWCSSPGLADIHEFHVVLGQSGLMGWADTPYSYLAMTKESEYSEEERLQLRREPPPDPFCYSVLKKRGGD